ncbi:hypothetical protein GETHLI_06280 [Geothrix limicola]|uniref:DUF5666 domain-containing protein n=1 Tax=Geothrix limicola TaxID=2927978 RepID=A0ABQ5QCG4_9BACT|nr:DUF5666 domain-containing protein [Geothrix limicola]GLH72126.1 hypothetical protein GETHLI_06280 [Geothrix limicola]
MVSSVRILVVSCGVALLSACGGSGYKTQSAPPPATGAQVTVVGALAGTASALQFNGQPVDATAATVTVNGQPGSAADLQPGVMLHAKGSVAGSSLHLSRADVRPDLCGPITAVDVTGGKITVLTKVVTVDALTVLVQQGSDHTFTPLALADFKVGDPVRAFGSTQSDGSFLATRIERRAAGTHEGEELRGLVSGLDAGASTFMIGTITVNYGSATVRGTLANGVRVEIGGTLSGTTFTATRVEVETDMEDDRGSAMELRGPVLTLDATAKTFTLLTFKVDFSAAAVQGTLAVGAVVEVEGNPSPTAPDTILATRVEVRFAQHGDGASDEEARGMLSAVSAADLTFTLGGTTYWTDAQTVFIRDDAAIAFSDLKVGDAVEVRALSTKTNAAGQPYASRVEEEGMH